MYFNNVHILIYVAIALIGLIVGKFIAWCNTRIPENKKVFSKEFFKENKNGLKNNYIFMIATAIIYIALLYKFGIKDEFIKNLDLIKFLILTPMLLLVFSIDAKHRIIPNRVNLTIFEIGLILTFIYGITNVNMAKEYILGMLAGGGIFLLIMLLGWIIAGKEAMGLGDVKFMGAIGLYFGTNTIAEISLLSFFIAAICSIFILIVRLLILKNKDEYIPFGPFLVIATLICIFLPSNYVFDTFLAFCKQIGDKIL
jgi:leader peptidase (prepilin peptidase)/N-methyltransferase